MPESFLKIKGARTHNLQHIDVDIPLHKLVVFTGPSGSGKSSLAIDTIFAESQRRFLDSFSGYARQFLDLMEKPDVDHISGLSPSICVDQSGVHAGPRSTVGTLTDVYGFLRLLYSQTGHRRSMTTGKRLYKSSVQEIVDAIIALPKEYNSSSIKLIILAPIAKMESTNLAVHLDYLRKEGFVRVRLNNKIQQLDENIIYPKNKSFNLDLVVDRLIIKAETHNAEKVKNRLTDSVELALKMAENEMMVHLPDTTQDLHFAAKYIDSHNAKSYAEMTPSLFSFNSPYGACETCGGLGIVASSGGKCKTCKGFRLKQDALSVTIAGLSIADCVQLSLDELQNWLLFLLKGSPSSAGFKSKSLPELFSFKEINPLEDDYSVREKNIASPIIKEICARLDALIKVGIPYLSLDRPIQSVSGGEARRIRLASQLSADLTGVLYVLDEPSIGLHQRDMENLMETIFLLVKKGNSVFIVEHDPETIMAADYVLELGPGAGIKGGKLTFAGNVKQLLKAECVTAHYLSGKKNISREEIDNKQIPQPGTVTTPSVSKFVTLTNACKHNLKNITIQFPLHRLTVVTGVSGSGKSTLVNKVLLPLITGQATASKAKLKGAGSISKTSIIDQFPIGRSSRSNPATYSGLYASIRNVFASTMDAKIRGYKPSRFSFNARGGRCEICKGEGKIKIDMQMMDDVFVLCEACSGTRFNRDTLQVKFKGKNIAEALDLSIDESATFFRAIPSMSSRLKMLRELGLGYLKLGQPGPTLSGGEAQRLKLATELAKTGKEHTLYLLDEPSVGLHFEDIKRLLFILHKLVQQNNTVLIIEHNLDIIKTADWIIDLGPDSGHKGGNVLAMGNISEIINCQASHTGKWLKKAILN
ncbi:MAG: ABC-ATPase UvrA [Fibrobacteria bacterium]|nr:ABC-ATPase UvrA [Fibrobacteria bacterium]